MAVSEDPDGKKHDIQRRERTMKEEGSDDKRRMNKKAITSPNALIFCSFVR